MTAAPYNPLAKINLGKSIADAFVQALVMPLSSSRTLVGAGVYALYYTGDFLPYVPISNKNQGGKFEQPIYVGKAIPEGGRKGGLEHDASIGNGLRKRLAIHSKSISQCENLNLADFSFRSLIVDDIWIPLGENMLIQQYRPIWNLVIDGFGNNKPGKGREGQVRSRWDVLHPGRKIALRLPVGDRTPEQVMELLAKHHAGNDVELATTEHDADEGMEEGDG